MSEEKMKYGILGKDDSSLEEKLSQYTGEVTWDYLKPHYEAGVLFFVDAELSLEEVGAAITRDEAEAVQIWKKAGDLVKIEALHARQWEQDSETQFSALVVSPFVLCRPLSVS